MKSLATDLKRAVFSPAPLISWVLISGVVSYTGPFGTYATVPFGARVLYWGIVIGFAILTGLLVRALVRHVLGTQNYWRNMVINASILAVFLSHPLRQFSLGMAGELHSLVPPYPEMAFLIFVVSIGVSALRVLLVVDGPATDVRDEDVVPRQGVAETTPHPQIPRLVKRLDASVHGDVIRLQVDDHYVTVVTQKGVGRLLMRFGDAISEVTEVCGLRVHRSHWVASQAVTGHEVEKGRLFLLTADGARIPVSRNHRPAVAESGLMRVSEASE